MTLRFAETIKTSLFAVARTCGLFEGLRRSGWRSKRLLILCYHGISQADEHLGTRELYMPLDVFRRRLEMLRSGGYRILSLSDGLARLRAGTLPPGAVSITFDDGFVDFLRVAYPLLQEFGFPATVYVSTAYVAEQLPVFPPILSYLLWKAGPREIDATGLVANGGPIRTQSPAERAAAHARLVSTVLSDGIVDPRARDEFAGNLAERLGVDYHSIRRQRLYYLMNSEELGALDRRLVDVQLHSHRHIQPADQSLFKREIEENRESLGRAGVPTEGLHHYCYPSGEVRGDLPIWLRESGVTFATTCQPGIVDPTTDPLLLPRFVDTQDVSSLKFQAWLCGAGALLPHRRR